MVALANKYPQCGKVNFYLAEYYFDREVWKAALDNYNEYKKKLFPNDDKSMEANDLEIRILKTEEKIPNLIETEKQLEDATSYIAKRTAQGKRRIDKKYNLELLFDRDKAELKPEGQKKLDRLTKSLMTKGAKYSLTLQGHTCNLGIDEYNMELSIKRAQAVKNYMVQFHGYPPALVKVEGYGSKKPLNENRTENGRRYNRRVILQDIIKP